MTGVRLYGTVAACAAIVYGGALWNQFAMDDNQIVAFNKLVLQFGGGWRAGRKPPLPRGRRGSAAALAAGLLSKENAMVAPALIAWGWIMEMARPSRRRMVAYVATWVAVGAVYVMARWYVLGHELVGRAAPVFFGASPVAVRL